MQNFQTQLREDRSPQNMQLFVIPQRHFLEPRFFASLIEDRTPGLQMDYAEFLRSLGGPMAPVAPAAPPAGQMFVPQAAQYRR